MKFELTVLRYFLIIYGVCLVLFSLLSMAILLTFFGIAFLKVESLVSKGNPFAFKQLLLLNGALIIVLAGIYFENPNYGQMMIVIPVTLSACLMLWTVRLKSHLARVR